MGHSFQMFSVFIASNNLLHLQHCWIQPIKFCKQICLRLASRFITVKSLKIFCKLRKMRNILQLALKKQLKCNAICFYSFLSCKFLATDSLKLLYEIFLKEIKKLPILSLLQILHCKLLPPLELFVAHQHNGFIRYTISYFAVPKKIGFDKALITQIQFCFIQMINLQIHCSSVGSYSLSLF